MKRLLVVWLLCMAVVAAAEDDPDIGVFLMPDPGHDASLPFDLFLEIYVPHIVDMGAPGSLSGQVIREFERIYGRRPSSRRTVPSERWGRNVSEYQAITDAIYARRPRRDPGEGARNSGGQGGGSGGSSGSGSGGTGGGGAGTGNTGGDAFDIESYGGWLAGRLSLAAGESAEYIRSVNRIRYTGMPLYRGSDRPWVGATYAGPLPGRRSQDGGETWQRHGGGRIRITFDGGGGFDAYLSGVPHVDHIAGDVSRGGISGYTQGEHSGAYGEIEGLFRRDDASLLTGEVDVVHGYDWFEGHFAAE